MNSTSIPRPEYPRPDFVRDSFQNLNGSWEFAFDDSGIGLEEGWYGPEPLPRAITVPYVYQSPLSGIGEKDFHSVVWYKKRFTFQREPGKSRTLLHFGAVDYEAKVWVNGQYQGGHTGGSTPFTFDVTQALTEGENIIAVRVQDDCFDLELPRGKQYWKSMSEGIFYTPSTGIWQTVWLEQVAENRLEKLWLTPNVDKKTIAMELELTGAGEKQVRVRLSLRGKTLIEDTMCIQNNRAHRLFWLDQTVTMDWNHQETMVWTPEDPVLFDLSLEVLSDGQVSDAVRSYCALRKVSVENGQFMLNNQPYYQKLLLDQGYWPDSLLTAPADEDFVRDIEAVKRMGFNGVRKHQKVEDPRFLYHADRMGLIVWGECPSAYVYSRKYARRMATEWLDIVARDYNHPCIVVWTPLNESWGVDGIMQNPEEQSHATSLYHLTKSLDQTRLVISNDGWNHTVSDLLTIHDYEGCHDVLTARYQTLDSILRSTPAHRTLYAQGHSYHGEPILVTEFGGIAYPIGKGANEKLAWGYTAAESEEDFLRRLEAVISAMQESPLVQGYCYTQLTDVEQEINGLMTYDRQFKTDPEKIFKINWPCEADRKRLALAQRKRLARDAEREGGNE